MKEETSSKEKSLVKTVAARRMWLLEKLRLCPHDRQVYLWMKKPIWLCLWVPQSVRNGRDAIVM